MAAWSAAANAESRAGSVDSAGQPAARGTSSALSLAEIDQVLIQNLDTELGLIEECCADLARPSRIFSLHG